MQIVIEISKDDYRKVQDGRASVSMMLKAIRKGTPLPEGHGRLIDADAFERRCMFDSNIEDMQDVIYALRDYKPIIEADNGK